MISPFCFRLNPSFHGFLSLVVWNFLLLKGRISPSSVFVVINLPFSRIFFQQDVIFPLCPFVLIPPSVDFSSYSVVCLFLCIKDMISLSHAVVLTFPFVNSCLFSVLWFSSRQGSEKIGNAPLPFNLFNPKIKLILP